MKKARIIIISLVSLIVLSCTVFTVLYFATDVFKSGKEIFYKNISQIDLSNILDTTQFNKYQERIQTEKFKNEGNLTVGMNLGEGMNINESFNYTSQVDNANKLADSNVTISKEGNDLLTINYLKNEDLDGFKFKNIINEYIALDNNKLDELIGKLNLGDTLNVLNTIELSEIRGIINFDDIDFTQIKTIGNKYLNVILENIPEENYLKVKNGSKLTVDIKTMQNILIKFIDTIKDDEEVFNLVKDVSEPIFDLISSILTSEGTVQQLTFEQYQEILKGVSRELQEFEIEENFNIIEIVVYKDGKICSKVGVDTEEQQAYIVASIEKTIDKLVLNVNATYDDIKTEWAVNTNLDKSENEEYNITGIIKYEEEEIANIDMTIKRNGNLTSDNIKNSMVLNVKSSEKNLDIEIQYSNDKTFDSIMEIKEFNEGNHVVINKLSTEQIQNLATNLSNLVQEKTGVNVIEMVGGAILGKISAEAVELEEIGILGGLGACISIVTTSSANLYNTSQNAMEETQDAIEREQELFEQMEEMQEQILSQQQNVQEQEVNEEDLYEDALQATKNTEKALIYSQVTGAVKLTDDGKINVVETYEDVKQSFSGKISEIKWDEDNKQVTFKITGNRGTYQYRITENLIDDITE